MAVFSLHLAEYGATHREIDTETGTLHTELAWNAGLEIKMEINIFASNMLT